MSSQKTPEATSIYSVKTGTRAEGYYHDVQFKIWASGDIELTQERVTIVARTINVNVNRGGTNNEAIQDAITKVLGGDISVKVERKRNTREGGFCWHVELS